MDVMRSATQSVHLVLGLFQLLHPQAHSLNLLDHLPALPWPGPESALCWLLHYQYLTGQLFGRHMQPRLLVLPKKLTLAYHRNQL
jgi:hypothetical protein